MCVCVCARVGLFRHQDDDEDGSSNPSPAVPRARSAATLVVAAVTLLPQWETELKRHAPSLRVLAYHGSTRARVKPQDLLTADVVLTSYSMLRGIVNITDAVEWHRVVFDGTSLRFHVVGSSFFQCLLVAGRVSGFHLFVLVSSCRSCFPAESQYLKNPLALTSILSTRLYAKHRWCATGACDVVVRSSRGLVIHHDKRSRHGSRIAMTKHSLECPLCVHRHPYLG